MHSHGTTEIKLLLLLWLLAGFYCLEIWCLKYINWIEGKNRGRQDICNKSTLLRKLTNYRVVLNSYACLVK